MDRKPRRPSPKKNAGGRSGMKNAGFIALLILFGLIIFTATNQPNALKSIPATTAVKDNNAGKYSSITVSGNQLDITPKGEEKATLKTYVDANASLQEQGFDVKKVTVTYKPVNSGSSGWVSLAESIIPIVIIAAILYFMLKSAQGQGNQAQEMADLQKQIIIATWKLQRQEKDTKPSAGFQKDAEVVQQSQELALERVQANLPTGFPERVMTKIVDGVREQARVFLREAAVLAKSELTV